MDRLLRIFFTRYFFPERILFLSVAGGMMIDGWLTAVFKDFSSEVILRIGLSLLALTALIFTYTKKASKKNIRLLAFLAIITLLSFSAYLNVIHHFDHDNALTFVGAYVICSLYFLSVRHLIIYLIFGFLLACIAVGLVDFPQINTSLFIFRLFLAALLVLGLSFATRQFQAQLQLYSKKVVEENRSLTEIKTALEDRLTHEHILSLVASRVNTAVIISNPDDVIEWVNEGFTELTGYTAEEAVGKKPEFLRGPFTDPSSAERIDEKKKKLIAFHDTILNYRKDGTPIWMQMHVTPILDENGKPERFIAIQEDITEIKETEKELRRSRELLKTAQRQAKIGSWEWNDKSALVNCSDEMVRMLGMEYSTADEKSGQGKAAPLQFIWDRVHPGDLSVVKKAIENGLRRNSPFEIDFRLVINGIVKYVYITGQAVSLRGDRTEMLVGTIQDITERKRIENEMRIAEKQYRSLFEHSQHMICIHDLQGNIMSINPAGAHAVGFEPEEIIGRSIKTFFWIRNPEEYEKYMQAINHNGQAQGLLRLSMRDDSTTYWLYNNILLADLEGNPYVLSSNVEITGRYEMEKELRNAKLLAEEALVIKDRFVTNISHELRTPMNAIIGFSDLLMKTPLNEEQREYLQAIHIAGDNLTSMINDVLDLAKIEAGKIEFEAKPFMVRNVMSNTHRLLSQNATQSNLSFEWKCDDAVPSYVLGDELRLTQILINLVGNAVKFTEKGFVHFHCTIKNETNESLDLEFLVEDSGIGIASEKMNVVFDPFIQGSAESTRKFGGTGLGLSIVRNLVELQGGSVSVKSAEGIGSAFTVILPVKKVSVEVIEQVEKALEPVDAPGNVHVLLVEDQPLNQQLAKKLISDFGFTAETAFNGKAAVDLLRTSTFDIVLMDLQMPEMDGYDAAKIIREKLGLDIPIIALTAHSSAGEREKCFALGMNDYLVKPFRAQELYFKIVSAVRKKVSGNIPAPESASSENPLQELAGGDAKFEKEMLELMLKSIPEDLTLIEEAIAANDISKIKTTAHRLKSSVALLGEKELAQALENLDKTNAEVVAEKASEIINKKPALTELIKKRLQVVGE
ncbi:MAG: PAS domain S-box protein [Bacteroidia bacterium]